MTTLLQDVRFALRGFRSSPGLFAVAILSVALGIGATSTIFSAVDAFMLQPLPFADEARLMVLYGTNAERGWDENSSSVPDVLDMRRESATMDIAAWRDASFNLGGDRPERVRAARVTWNLPQVMGTTPALGRGFTPEEEVAGPDRVALLTHDFWTDRFAADPGAVGAVLRMDGEPYTVVGVLPRWGEVRRGQDLYVPLGVTGEEPRASRMLDVYARVRPEVGVEAARSEAASLAARLAARHPGTNEGIGARLLPIRDDLFDATFRQATAIAIVAVLFVLLIACANVANLLLARATGREREIAVRTALGARRARIARQLLTESALLGLLGGLVGLALAVVGTRLLMGTFPPGVVGAEKIELSLRTVAFTAVAALGAAFVFGLAPALRGSSPDVQGALRDGGRGSTAGGARGRLRKALVVTELALSLVLLVSAGLLVKAFIGLRTVDPGFETGRLLAFNVALPENAYPDSASTAAFHAVLAERLRSLPGVESVSGVDIVPMTGNSWTYYQLEGDPVVDEARRPLVGYRAVLPGYAATMGIPLLRGRDLTEQDRYEAAPVVVINQAMQERHWPDADPIGDRLVFSSGARTIVGVVGNTLDNGPEDPPFPLAYVPALQRSARLLGYMLRTTDDPGAAAAAARAAVAELDPDLAPYDVTTMRQVVRDATRGDEIMGKLLGVFAGIALLLAVVGVYGVMAYSVSQRLGEVGVRMALGARATDILRLILRQGAALAGMGIGIGLVVAAGATRALSAFLHGVSSYDPMVFGGVTVALLGAALGASVVPALRAAAVDPQTALRTE